MTAIQIYALISIVIALGILYWVGYKGGLTDGRVEGYEDGHAQGCMEGMDQGESASATELEQVTERCQRLQLILDLQPQDRLTLLTIAEKLKLAADTFRAVRSESQATQALALRDKALSMAALMDPFTLEDAA
ncbi:hypothetical protein P0D91_01900 [Pseudomonas sp. CBSPBW29]|uniref:hypothetical protein n=1 Tax=Pseudomonas sp. CBS TaxID=2971912 RepID=UPI0021AC0EAE|nr:hypothetical protein [Pseudomonas sp. CBS]WEL43143.1 hypothetical protein P0D91_01900 [Pseudomonas sp. CBSPBW29]WEL64210.1 hypothetical protein P0D93_29470 [Pseudomonas sp. CBSPGW29]WEL73392.1 hypothetical protein P0D94_15380 [Pseudomonas sp. CBSPCGW29]WEL74713.1 hypothetical protein P0D92_21435 [Pseudomonas sp. CBSPAW29]WEL81047.1 hypothetical protein P0D95_24380 [Pseudomonas sp. CBSPCAW29]WEL89556.1 hypothetical protein P0D90_06710 [Pseudomonas sp. CBSPCBW29]